MLDRKGKGKGKAKASYSKRKRSQPTTKIMDRPLTEKHLTDKEKTDQAMPSSDSVKFANFFCELRLLQFLENWNLHMERKLRIPLMSGYFIRFLASISYSFSYDLFKFYYIFIGEKFMFLDSTLSLCFHMISGNFWLKSKSFGEVRFRGKESIADAFRF
ncbi:uncharacterized protein DS421_18g620390 [Arachis hypogaea]|nr:uncharacterized protein DS421_18g620390 [Arachis hypogaea]